MGRVPRLRSFCPYAETAIYIFVPLHQPVLLVLVLGSEHSGPGMVKIVHISEGKKLFWAELPAPHLTPHTVMPPPLLSKESKFFAVVSHPSSSLTSFLSPVYLALSLLSLNSALLLKVIPIRVSQSER